MAKLAAMIAPFRIVSSLILVASENDNRSDTRIKLPGPESAAEADCFAALMQGPSDTYIGGASGGTK
jgi:hypothetical protein